MRPATPASGASRQLAGSRTAAGLHPALAACPLLQRPDVLPLPGTRPLAVQKVCMQSDLAMSASGIDHAVHDAR